MGVSKSKGVFCLEGDWESDLRSKRSVQPVLQLLEHSGFPKVPSIRRDVGTVAELEHYLAKWYQSRYGKFPILYLAFHGDPGLLYVSGARTTVDLDWLEGRLEGRAEKSVIHFGSCARSDTSTTSSENFAKAEQGLEYARRSAEVAAAPSSNVFTEASFCSRTVAITCPRASWVRRWRTFSASGRC